MTATTAAAAINAAVEAADGFLLVCGGRVCALYVPLVWQALVDTYQDELFLLLLPPTLH